MSYLDVPRIHIAGRFFTDPSTINNDPTHYKEDNTTPSPWQNPVGQHRFQLKDCTVRSVVDAQGLNHTDKIVAAALQTTDTPSPAKIVDLDVYQQGVPTIYGLRVQIALDNEVFILGTADPATLNQMWWNSVLPTRSWQSGDYVQDSFGGDMNACAYFQTVVRIKKQDWKEGDSAILKAIRENTVVENEEYLLSFMFVLDGYQNVPQNKQYLEGRIVGTLGIVKANEPRYNPGQRWLLGRSSSPNDPWNFPSFNQCPFKIDKVRKKLVIDLANGICRQSAGGDPVELGSLNAKIKLSDTQYETIGEVDYSSFAYEDHAQMAELDLTDAQIGLLEKNSLVLEISRTDIGDSKVFKENIGVLNYCVEQRPIRMAGDAGTTASTQVYVNHLGVPMANEQLSVLVISVHGNTPGATVPPSNPGNTPQADGALIASISPTDEHGFATMNFTVLKDPGERTSQLDGQLYFVVAYDPARETPDWTQAPIQEHIASVLAFAHYEIQAKPSWDEIKRIFAPYMKLFPSMRELIDLTDLQTFTIFSKNPPWDRVYHEPKPGPFGIKEGAIPFFMTRDFNDPRYMPLTRDLSPAKVQTILHFIKNVQDTPTFSN
jgi:hypothetical protein